MLVLLMLIMVVGLMPVSTGAVEVRYPSELSGSTGGGNYQHVYYGEYGGNSIRWRVLDNREGELFLLSEGLVAKRFFGSNKYGTASIRTWLLGYFMSSFTGEEQEIIRPQQVFDPDTKEGINATYDPSGDKVFLLSRGEVSVTYFPRLKADRISTDMWWLRTSYDTNVQIVNDKGEIKFLPGGSSSLGIRPASKLDLSSILFAPAADTGETATLGKDLTAVSQLTGDMKLTIADDSNQTLSIDDVTANSSTSGSEVTVNYSGATPSSSNYLCVELTSESDTYRGAIKELTAGNASGTATFNLPTALTYNSYTLKLWNEKYNPANHTNYGSTPVTTSIEFANPIINVIPFSGIVATQFNGNLTAQGGFGPYSWSVTGLPSGLSLDSSTGEISGTPEDTGTYNLTTTVTDSDNKTDTANYTLTIYQTFSIDLANLTVDPGTLSPGFHKNIVTYQVNAVSSINSIDITAVMEDPGSTLTIAGSPATHTVTQSVYLDQGANLIPIVVTASGGHTQKSYVISVNGTASDANLASLSVNGHSLNPVFSAGETNYTINLDNSVETLELSASTSDTKALMLVEGAILNSGDSQTINLDTGENTIEVMVVAQDASTQTYTVTVNRATGNVDLSGLTLSDGILNQTFDPSVNQYTADVVNSISEVIVTPTLSDSEATTTVNGDAPSLPVSLEVGENTINIVVTGKDGVSTKTYQVIITRKEVLTINNESLPIGIIGGSYDATMTAAGGTEAYTWTATGLPAELTLNENGEITGTLESEGNYLVEVKVTDSTGTEASKTLSLRVNLGSGNGAYIIHPIDDTTYTKGYTEGAIPIMTVKEGISGFKYFSALIEPVTGNSGNEVCVFIHIRNGQQISINATKADFDTVNQAKAAFNVRAGDIIKSYIVDDLTNDPDTNPNVL